MKTFDDLAVGDCFEARGMLIDGIDPLLLKVDERAAFVMRPKSSQGLIYVSHDCEILVKRGRVACRGIGTTYTY